MPSLHSHPSLFLSLPPSLLSDPLGPTSFAASLSASHTNCFICYATSHTKLLPLSPLSLSLSLSLSLLASTLKSSSFSSTSGLSLSLISNRQILLSLSRLNVATKVVEAAAREEARRGEEVGGARESSPAKKKPKVEKLLRPWICRKGNEEGHESLGLLDGSEEEEAILDDEIDVGNEDLEIGRGLGD